VGRLYCLYLKASVWLPITKKRFLSSTVSTSPTRCGDAAISNATMNAKIYNTVIQRTYMAAVKIFAFKIAAKPLQIETWLLLTAYGNSSSLYLTTPSPTPYDVLFSHNTCVTNGRRIDDRQTTHCAKKFAHIIFIKAIVRSVFYQFSLSTARSWDAVADQITCSNQAPLMKDRII